MKTLTITLFFFFFIQIESTLSKPKKKIRSIKYFNKIYGHIHRNPSRYSESLTTISCGHPIKIVAESKKSWSQVKAGSYMGHIKDEFLSTKRPRCFQDKYPKFFSKFDFSLSELYYWGRLNDQYVTGKSVVN